MNRNLLKWSLQNQQGDLSVEQERIARLILTTVIALGSWGPPFFFIFWFVGLKAPAVIVGVTSAILWSSPILLRNGFSVSFVSNLITGLFWFAITSISWFAGGIQSPVMITLVAVAMLAWLLTQGFYRVMWLFLTLCSILGFFVAEKWGLQNPNVLPHDIVIYLRPVILIAVIAISLSVVWFFEYLKNNAMSVLAESYKDIEKNQQELVRLTHDLSAARDEALRASRTKSSFLANMSHELRTPLNTIIGYSELLFEEAMDEEDQNTADELAKIHSAGEHLLALIAEILDLSKIEAGHIEIVPEEFTLSSFLDDVSIAVIPLATKRTMNFRFILTRRSVRCVRIRPVCDKSCSIYFQMLANSQKAESSRSLLKCLRTRTENDCGLRSKIPGLG